MPDETDLRQIIKLLGRALADSPDGTDRELDDLTTALGEANKEITRLRAELIKTGKQAGVAPEVKPGLFLERCVCGETELVSGECEAQEFHAGHPDCGRDVLGELLNEKPTVDEFWARYGVDLA